jgi:hypothetical protein
MHASIPEDTTYFSAASARDNTVSVGSDAMQGPTSGGYIYWKSNSSIPEVSVRSTTSSRDGITISSTGNPSECLARFLRWTLKSTPSLDLIVMSESAAET